MDCASSQLFSGNCFPSTAGLRIFLLHLCGVFLRCVLQLNSWHRVFVLEFFLGQACSPAFGFFADRQRFSRRIPLLPSRRTKRTRNPARWNRPIFRSNKTSCSRPSNRPAAKRKPPSNATRTLWPRGSI